MTTRFALLELIARTKLDSDTTARLWQLAGFDRPPPTLIPALGRGLAIAGAGCAGLGLVFWVAANWGVLSRFQQFALLQALVAVLCVGTAAMPRARVPLGLLALVAVGGLFAYFGQTYQTGADPWQLFALWAGLSLPLALGLRSDVVWSAWCVVAAAAIFLWARPGGPFDWIFMDRVNMAQGLAALGAGLLTAAMSAPLRRYTGAGIWAFGMALLLSAAFVTCTAVANLFGSHHELYWFDVVLAGIAAGIFAGQTRFDVFAASVVALALNIMLVAGMAIAILPSGSSISGLVFTLMLLGIFAAGMMAGSVKLILDLSRKAVLQGEYA